MKEFITNNLTLVERRTNTLEGHYSRYLSANFIDDKNFDDVIKELGGYTYNVLVGKVGDVTIFNGFTWISVHDVSSYEECDKWAKVVDKMLFEKGEK